MITAIIQARTSSSRLPEKVLKELPFGSGITALEQVIRRLKKSKRIDQIMVATTIDEKDISIVEIAQKENVKWYRGSIENVLERYIMAAKECSADHVVRITSDCPCVDAEMVDYIINKHFEQKADYTTNGVKRTYPDGFDVEVINFDVLETAYQNATNERDKEHVTPYIHESPDKFEICHVEAPEALRAPEMRITLDTPEDYLALCAVFDYLYERDPFFPAADIMNLYRQKPWLNLINQNSTTKKACETLDDEIKELMHIADFQNYQKGRELLEEYLVKQASR